MPSGPREDPVAPSGDRGRRHDLDALRAIAMLLGIALHAALAYLPAPWPIDDPAKSIGLGVAVEAIHGFRMPLFFLLSGFFTAMLWRRRGLGALIAHRAKRILLPLVLGAVILVPAIHLVCSVALDLEYSEVEDVVRRASHSLGTVELGEGIDAPSLAEEPRDLVRPRTPLLHHLWFLYYLVLLVTLFAPCFWIVDRLGAPSPPTWITGALATALLWIPLTCIAQARMHRGGLVPGFGPDTSIDLWVPGHLLLYYALFFGFGTLLYGAGERGERIGWSWRFTLPFALIGVLPLGLGVAYGEVPVPEALGGAWERRLEWGSATVYTWLMIFACLGAAREFLNSERPALRYLSDASYWMYLAHLPLVLGLQLAVRDLAWAWLPKLTLVVVGSTGLLLLGYRHLVRHTIVGRTLNGPRPRVGSRGAK